MQAQDIKTALLRAGVYNLYHTNTVVTALSFIKNGGLLSRQYAESLNAAQTEQITDNIDREYGIYNDIFFDSVDIHERAHRPNHYGPVMFVYSIDVLDTLQNYDICITKDNPYHWRGEMSYEDRYFTNPMELLFGFAKGNFYQHITVRDISVPLPFDYLREIVIDNPGIVNIALLTQSKRNIKEALDEIGAEVPITIRKCPATCGCLLKNASREYIYNRFRAFI